MSDLSDTAPHGPILTLEEVAERVQLSTRTIYRAILAGDLEASQLTQRRGGWRVYESALVDWLALRSNSARGRTSREPRSIPRLPVLPLRASRATSNVRLTIHLSLQCAA